MNHLFVIVGMSAVGKTTMLQDISHVVGGAKYFKNDEICRHIWSVYNISGFGVKNKQNWSELDKLGNVTAASFWIHLAFLVKMESTVGFAEGYGYFYKGARTALESATNSVHPDCQIHYLHLNPPLQIRNHFRAKRGFRPITQEQLDSQLSSIDLRFVSHEIESMDDLMDVLTQYGIAYARVRSDGGKCACDRVISYDTSDLQRPARKLDSIRIGLRRNSRMRFATGRVIRALRRMWRDIVST